MLVASFQPRGDLEFHPANFKGFLSRIEAIETTLIISNSEET